MKRSARLSPLHKHLYARNYLRKTTDKDRALMARIGYAIICAIQKQPISPCIVHSIYNPNQPSCTYSMGAPLYVHTREEHSRREVGNKKSND